MTGEPSAIAVDGPAASGKTVVGRRLARLLGYRFLDTGAMYRAVTWLALDQGVAPDDADALTRIAKGMAFESIEQPAITGGTTPDTAPRVLVHGRDVTAELLSLAVERAVSQVAQVAGVRHALVQMQREMAGAGNIVMAGRDIGTVVLPDAHLKVFLEASAPVRAHRRFEEMRHKGASSRYEDVLADLQRRDKLDSERTISPLMPAPDAQRVDTDGYTIDQVVEKLWKLTAKP